MNRLKSILTLTLIILMTGSIFATDTTVLETDIRQIAPARESNDNQIRVLLYFDMEGVSGQNILTSIDFPRPEYFEARELLTADINAVVDGLFEGGADSVFVVDAHGSFNPEPDVILDKMDKRARMLFKKKKFHPYVDLLDENDYDAVVAVAMHSRTGGGGFAEHTVNLGTDWILNGKPANESEILAYAWGTMGVPLIFVSGDDKLAGQLEWMDWLEYVTVKEANGIDDAVLYPLEEVHRELTISARRSIETLTDKKATTLNTPITATLRVGPPADLSILRRVPGLDYHDQSVTFTAADYMEMWNGMRGLLDVAQTGYYEIVFQLYMAQGDEAFMKFKNAIFDSWRESTQEPEPKETSAESTPAEERFHFGSR